MTCEQCRGEFTPHPKESKAKQAERRFCSRGCAARWQRAHKPSNRASGVCPACGAMADPLIRGLCQPCYSRANYQANRDKRLRVRREWRERNPDYWRQPRIKAAALQRAIARYHGDPELRDAALARDRHRCRKCGAEERLHVHHIDGDRNNQRLDNLATLCSACHGRLHRMAQRSGRPIAELFTDPL